MSQTPLRATSDVFDESVLKLEFLPMPTQIPDYSLNLNTETLYYRLQMLMQNVIGPIRVNGGGVTYGGGNVTVAPGLVLFKNYYIRMAAPTVFGLIASPKVVYVQVTESLKTADSDPTIVNVNPPLALTSLPGPNQYRYTFTVGYADTVPADTSTTFCFKLCDVSAAGVISNLLPVYTKKIGAIDLNAMELASADYATRISILEAAIVAQSSVTLNETLSVGDLVKVVNNGGPKAAKLVASAFTQSFGWGGGVYSSQGSVKATVLDATHVMFVTNGRDGTGFRPCSVIGTFASSKWNWSRANYHDTNIFKPYGNCSGDLQTLDATHVIWAYSENSPMNMMATIGTVDVSAGTVTWLTPFQVSSQVGSYYTANIAVLDSTHFVVMYPCVVANAKLNGVVCTYTGSAITSGGDNLKTLTSNNIAYAGFYNFGGKAAVALTSSLIFICYNTGQAGSYYLSGLAGTVSGNSITWGTEVNYTTTGTNNNQWTYGVCCAVTATKVAVVFTYGATMASTCVVCANIAGTVITWSANNWTVAAGAGAYSHGIRALDSTHIVVDHYNSTDLANVSVFTIGGGDALTRGNVITHPDGTFSHILHLDASNYVELYKEPSCPMYSSVHFTAAGNTSTQGATNYVMPTQGDPTSAQFELSTAKLDSSNFVLAANLGASISAGNGLYCRVVTLTNGVPTGGLWANPSFSVGNGSGSPKRYHRILALDANTFIFAMNNGTNIYMKVGTISAGVITFGAEYTFAPTGVVGFALSQVSATKFLVTYNTSGTDVSTRVCTISGTVITINGATALYTLGSGAVVNVESEVMSSTRGYAVFLHNDSTQYIRQLGFTIGSTTVTPDGSTGATLALSGTVNTQMYLSLHKMDSTTLIMKYHNIAQAVRVVLLSCAGSGALVVINEVPLSPTPSTWCESTVIPLDSSRFLLCYGLGSSAPFIQICQPCSIASGQPMQDGVGTAFSVVDQIARPSYGVALSPTVAFVPASGFMALTIDERTYMLGIMQEAGTAGQMKKVAYLGQVSKIHVGLTPGVRYGLDGSLNLLADQKPFLGLALSTTDMALKGLS